MKSSAGSQVGVLARRSILGTIRQPVVWLPNVFFGLFMLAVLSGAGKNVTKVPGFPTKSYTAFILGAILVQTAASASTLAGNALGTDVETGFLSRMSLTPMRGWTLIAAQLGGVAVLGAIQAALFIAVGVAAGANIKTGLGGAVVVELVILLMILAFGSIGLLVAVQTGSSARVQTLFGLSLGLLFMSSMVMPRNLIKEDWFKTIATINPMSYLVEAPRNLLTIGWDGKAIALGCGIALFAMVLALAMASSILRKRISGR